MWLDDLQTHGARCNILDLQAFLIWTLFRQPRRMPRQTRGALQTEAVRQDVCLSPCVRSERRAHSSAVAADFMRRRK